MSKPFLLALAPVLCVVAGTTYSQSLGPNLGRVATPDEIARVDLTVAPDSTNLPPGSGSVAKGGAVYLQNCLACHGERGLDGPMGSLTGGIGTLTSEAPVKTVTSYWPYAESVFDYVRRAMPLNAPQSLTNDQVYAVTAYILSIDGIVAEDAVLDAETLPRVQMSNRDGFVSCEPDRTC